MNVSFQGVALYIKPTFAAQIAAIAGLIRIKT